MVFFFSFREHAFTRRTEIDKVTRNALHIEARHVFGTSHIRAAVVDLPGPEWQRLRRDKVSDLVSDGFIEVKRSVLALLIVCIAWCSI